MSLASFLRVSGKRLLWGTCLAVPFTAATASAATPTAEQALRLMPVQKDVDFDRPTEDEAKKCTIDVEKTGETSGWIVKNSNGAPLRRFLDMNGDNTVDLWCYYADGIEVYRDVDTNANGKADQARWLNTAGTRWGVDANEDGVVDAWKQISAEEVSSEAVQAMAAKDVARFQRLLLTPEELKSLGLGDKYTNVINDKLTTVAKRFSGLVSDSKFATVATGSTKWLNFSGTRPGLVPAGTEGTTKDVVVYENVAAMMELGGKAGQVQIGTMIRVGDLWRLIDVPTPVGESDQQVAVNNLFFNAAAPAQIESVPGGATSADGKAIFDDLQEIEGKLAKATPAEIGSLKKQRSDLIEKALPSLKETTDRVLWTRQLIDSLSEGVQTNSYPGGLARLKELEKKLALGSDKELVSYARFSTMTAEYILAQSDPKADFTKVQSTWLENLRAFVKDFPASFETSEAMLHLAIDAEFAGKEDEAKKLYSEIAGKFPQAAAAKKAAGAVRRLDSIGKAIALTGTTIDGKSFDLKAAAGRPTLLYYFATGGATTAGDVALLRQVQAKYPRELNIVGISLDSSKQDLTAYLQQNKLPWINLYEDGGMENRFANEMGILTIPTIILLDARGAVINRSVHVSELDKEVGNTLRR